MRLIDTIQVSTATPDQSGPMNNGNKEMNSHFPELWSENLTIGYSLVLYSEHPFLGEMQSTYFKFHHQRNMSLCVSIYHFLKSFISTATASLTFSQSSGDNKSFSFFWN